MPGVLIGFFDLAIRSWLTPVWVLCVGMAVGLLAALLVYGIAAVTLPRVAAAMAAATSEAAMWMLFWFTVGMSSFAVLGWFVAFTPNEILASVGRIPYVGEQPHSFSIAAAPASGDLTAQPLEVSFLAKELDHVRFRSSVALNVYTQPFDEEKGIGTGGALIRVPPDQDFEWKRGAVTKSPFVADEVTEIYAVNQDLKPGTLDLTIVTAPQHPEASLIPLTAVCVFATFLLYFLQSYLSPRLSAVALATVKSELAQPLFWIITAMGIFAVILTLYTPYNTFGEDIKMFKLQCFDLILVLSLIQAVWAASNSVSDEIEGRTALTVLSKPLARWQFVLGKFVGIAWTVLLLFVFLGITFLVFSAYKPLYDAREAARTDPAWQECYLEMVRTVPGLVLLFMEAMVLASLSVAISTRLPIVANFIIVFAVYALGNISPLIVQSSSGDVFPPVRFAAQLIATVLPVLEHFNVEAAVASGTPVSLSYLGVALVYCLLFTGIAMLLALLSFEDRDLA